MNYQIGNVSIDSHTGKILADGIAREMRPKTLQVLLYLLDKRDRIVSKRELLSVIWHDVVTQDYVLYQSINEIRSFFQEVQVVRTFPRQGYQWIAVAENYVPVAKPYPGLRHAVAVLVTMALVPLIIYTFYFVKMSLPVALLQRANVAVQEHTVIVNPLVDATFPLQENSGAYSSGQTEMLAGYLASIPRTHVQPVLPAQGLNTAMVSLAEITTATQSFLALDADTYSLHTRLYKQMDEYQLHYVLLGASATIRGVIFSNNAAASFSELATCLGKFMTEGGSVTSNEVFASEALFLGMEAFLKQDYAIAETFLHTAAILKPDALPSWRYLSRAQIQQGKFDLASATIREALNTITFIPKNGFELKLLNQLKAIANPVPASQPNQPGDSIA